MSEHPPKKEAAKTPELPPFARVTVEKPLSTDPEKRIQEQTDKETVQRLQQRLQADSAAPSSPKDTKATQAAYVDHHLPAYLKEPSSRAVQKTISGLMSVALKLREKLLGWKVTGREAIPNGPYLALCNHQGGESGILMGLFSRHPMHLVSGEQIHWHRSPLRTWLLKKLGMLPVKESLGYLSSNERTALIERAHPRARAGYEAVVTREAAATPGERLVDLRTSVRSIVACLVRGEPVSVFPEGLFLYNENKGMRRGYPLADAVALEYERVTGLPLRLLPIAIDSKQVTVGASFTTHELPKVAGISKSDTIIAQVASLLPAERQGYYLPILKKLRAEG